MWGDTVVIRQEEAKDHNAVYSLVKWAFETAEHADGNEHELVNALRKSDAYIPALSLVAEIDGRLAGHILFTKAEVGGCAVLALAPLSVLPEYQRQGVGTALIQEGHQIARTLGYGWSIVLGSAAYYPRFGYRPADTFGIRPPFDVPRENFMACKLLDRAPNLQGTIRYAKEFGIETPSKEESPMYQPQSDELLFFEEHSAAIPLYAAFAGELFRRFPVTSMRVQKSQITFSNRHVYACVSFARVRKKSELPEAYMVVTLGLPYPLDSDRVAVKTEPYPGRWTTHLVVGDASELDEEFWVWTGQAYEFAENK